MRIRSVHIRGFRNLVDVRADGLGDLVVIYGGNSVGKSNVLDAIALGLRAVAQLGRQNALWRGEAVPASQVVSAAEEWTSYSGDLFALGRPSPVRIAVAVNMTAEELARAGVEPLKVGGSPTALVDVTLAFLFKPHPSWRVSFQLESYRIASLPAIELLAAAPPAAEAQLVGWANAAAWRAAPVGSEEGRNVALHRVDARVAELPAASDGFSRPRLSQDLLLAAYDHRESANPEQSNRWRAFEAASASFSPVLGSGRWVPTYDRVRKVVSLYWESGDGRLPLHLLGGGVQQAVAVLFGVLFTDAKLVLMEEPEAQLRGELQAVLADALATVAAVPDAPQVIMASHSPFMAPAAGFWHLVRGANGPTLSHEPRHRVPEVIPKLYPETHSARDTTAWVDSEGVVRLPEWVRARLRLPGAGGVLFMEGEAPASVEMRNSALVLEDLLVAEGEG